MRRFRLAAGCVRAGRLLLVSLLLSVQAETPVPCGRMWTAATPTACLELPLAEQQSVQLSSAFFARSVLNFGALSNATSEKLSSSSCLRLLAIGGSITCGAMLCNVGDRQRQSQPCPEAAWPQTLARMLNQALPCQGGSHSVRNSCTPAVASDHWVDQLASGALASLAGGVPSGRVSLADFDIALVETAVNDGEDLAQSDRLPSSAGLGAAARARVYTELLVRLLQRSPGLSVVYVAASTRGPAWAGDYPRTTDAAHAQLDVTRLYDVPHASLVDGLGPLRSEAAQRWFSDQLRVDPLHPGPLGHAVIAAMLTQLLLLHAVAAQRPFLPGLATPFGAAMPEAPLFAAQSVLNMYLTSRPLHIAAAREGGDPHALTSVGFSRREDVAGKPGLIAEAVGAVVVFALSPAEVAGHVRAGALHVSLLKSYARMGSALVEVREGQGEAGGLLGSTVFDCAWEAHVSEVAVLDMDFNGAAGGDAAAAGAREQPHRHAGGVV